MQQPAQHEENVIHSSIGALLRMRAQQQPSNIAYTFVTGRGPNCEKEQELTYAELDRRARAIAYILSELGMRGRPAILTYPPGIDYIAAFFGCMYAGVIAVPACPPELGDPMRLDRSLSRLVAIVRDAAPAALLTTTAIGTALWSLPGPSPELSRLRMVMTDHSYGELGSGWTPEPAGAEEIAMLQYTSGSTYSPRGVVLTHRNLISNSELIARFFSHSGGSRAVSWLPPYHDMGLIGGIIQPLYGGFPVTLMAPADFIKQPLRWLQEISRTRATISGGPNFGYDLCVRKTTAEERSQLDLSSWRIAFNGSEPVRAETMQNFARAFEPTGFKREAFHPCYGLAEATLIVTGGLPWSRRGIKSFDAASLRYGAAISSAPDGRSRGLVSCGFASGDRRVVIADPDTRVECATGQVGEIWISGRSVASSYWRRPEETGGTFGARLAGTGEGPFLRSGDLGFMLGRQLFVTGRLKDLIVIRGRNHHPQDIELTAGHSSTVLRQGCGAAFTVARGDQELLVIAYEITRQASHVQVGEVAAAVRGAVAAEHEIGVHTVVLLPPGGIPKTSSGKIQRRLCAAMFTGGQLAELGRSVIGQHAESARRPESAQLHLDRSSLLGAPAGERQDLLHDYLCRLVASACGLDVKQAADVPLLALGVDSCAVVSIQHSIETDLRAHLTVSDLAHAASIADLAIRLDQQLSVDSSLAQAKVTRTAADQDSVRLYCWAGGSRVPAHAGSAADWAGWRREERPRRASLRPAQAVAEGGVAAA